MSISDNEKTLVSTNLNYILKRLHEQGKFEAGQKILKTLEAAIKDLKNIEPGIKRARYVYQDVDTRIAYHKIRDPGFKDVPCKKGCAYCCHINVDITRDEALLINDVVKRQDIHLDLGYLREQAKYKKEDYAKNLKNNAKCIFLKSNNTCRIHNHRPTSCRTYFVADDPEKCDTSKSNVVAMVNIVSLEILFTALMNVESDKKMESMPRRLLELLEVDGCSI